MKPNRINSKKVRAFTLLEMMVTLTILILIASFASVHIKKLVDRHRFESGVGDLFISLQEAQVLSAAYQTDFSLDISEDKGSVSYRFLTDEPFLEKKFSQEKKALSQVVQCKFKDKKCSHLHFDIYSGGRIEPQGVIAFLSSLEENAPVLYLDLQYGDLIKFCYTKPSVFRPLTQLSKPIGI